MPRRPSPKKQKRKSLKTIAPETRIGVPLPDYICLLPAFIPRSIYFLFRMLPTLFRMLAIIVPHDFYYRSAYSSLSFHVAFQKPLHIIAKTSASLLQNLCIFSIEPLHLFHRVSASFRITLGTSESHHLHTNAQRHGIQTKKWPEENKKVPQSHTKKRPPAPSPPRGIQRRRPYIIRKYGSNRRIPALV